MAIWQTSCKEELEMNLEAFARSSRIIKSEKDIVFIKNKSERAFAVLILERDPNLLVVYEPIMFETEDPQGRTRGTLPDFYVVHPDHPSRGIFVEITTTLKKEERIQDPKGRQRWVMQKAAPDERYVVLYGENLQNMQMKHRHLDFGIAYLEVELAKAV